ncbi:MAG TPA: hypothetical protein RMH99_01215 [Sandaracinaceae bacterium LLY-WYZ-13_1]|nr:hypothetical protein [Sandaracinaceae bacterium LLY-WYZ-13_1]
MTERSDEARELGTREADAEDLPTGEELPAIEELGGESEHSITEAGRASPEAPATDGAGPPRREPLNPEADELGRRFLEDATQAPAQPEKATVQSISARPLADVMTSD